MTDTYPPDAGTFGGTISETYIGQGDYRIGTLSGALGAGEGGSYLVALGSPDFSSEWVMAAPYSAVVISGLIDTGATSVAVTETNDSLHLLSQTYRNNNPAPYYSLFKTDSKGKLQKQNNYTYDPNRFIPWGTSGTVVPGIERGGYAFLISKKANPQTAFFEIEYQNGKKRRIEVDYGAVELRQEVPLDPPTGVWFQNPTPADTPAGTYSLTNSPNSYEYAVTGNVNATDIAWDGDKAPTKPLYLRPFYDPPDIDPNKAATNMIKEIYLTNTEEQRLTPSEIGNLVLRWNDAAQAITLELRGSAPENVTYYQRVVINAELRLWFEDTGGAPIKKLMCEVTIDP
jgi:hypothetical protein